MGKVSKVQKKRLQSKGGGGVKKKDKKGKGDKGGYHGELSGLFQIKNCDD